MEKVINKFIIVIVLISLNYNQTIAKDSKTKKYIDYVNPIIGTNGMGHTFPGACAPFSGIQLSPDTDTIPMLINEKYQKKVYEYCAGYQYKDSTIVGFSHRHFSGTGHSDLGDILIMPSMGDIKLNPGTSDRPYSGYRSKFSHDTEVSKPGYYSVLLDDYKIKAELTASSRCGIHKYTFPKNSDTPGHIILDLNHGIYNYDGKTLWANIRVENDTLITGYRITNGWARTNYTYFAISFSKPIIKYGYQDLEKIKYNGFWRRFDINHNFPEMSGRKLVSYFEFDTKTSNELVIKVGISAVSTNGALANLKEETSKMSFEDLVSKTQNEWEKELSCIDAQGTYDQLCMFYTSLYHTMINPSIYQDVDGQYRGLDHNIHKAKDFTNYTIFSLWDTYRAEHPFLNLMKTKNNLDMISSMLAHQEQSVHKMLPVWSHMANENWCMSGYHSVSVLAEAIVTNSIKDEMAERALKAMIETSNVKYYAGLNSYLDLGYVAIEENSNAASTTLEYSYDDWCIAAAAKHLNKHDIAEIYEKRAKYYKNIFDYNNRFIRPKHNNGQFKKDFDPLQTNGEGFIEGNSFNFTFHAPHDVEGMIELIGGEKAFINRLNELFEMDLPKKYYEKNEDITKEGLLGGYVHGNEPSHHIPYLYTWTSDKWRTQYWLREIMNRMYKNHIDGLSGNDDCGQMSAWYIFTAMGFYPVCPASGKYIIGAPYLPYMKLYLSNNKTLEIVAKDVSDKNRYVKSVILNNKEIRNNYISYDDIMQGGILEFNMSSKK